MRCLMQAFAKTPLNRFPWGSLNLLGVTLYLRDNDSTLGITIYIRRVNSIRKYGCIVNRARDPTPDEATSDACFVDGVKDVGAITVQVQCRCLD